MAVDVVLALLVAHAVLGFGWRSWLQYRRTGSTGVRGVSGRIGSVEWMAGVGFVVGERDPAGRVPARPMDSGRRDSAGNSRIGGRGFRAARDGRLLAHRGGRDRDHRARALAAPNPVALGGSAALFIALELQVRRVEEPYLLQKHGDAYRSYIAAVGRFLPGVGLGH